MTSTKRDSEPGGVGRLWVVATPIGSMEDVTLRALRVLREADAVLAEDTRRTRTLLVHYGVDTPLRAFHAHSTAHQLERLVGRLTQGQRLALVTDAGTPGISDPGVQLVRAAQHAGVRVESVPGPSAVTAAVSVAGLRCDTFRFVGFLPRSGGRRRRALEAIAADPAAAVLFESPNRLAHTLGELATHLPAHRQVAVCRELTKVHEEVVRGSSAELADHFADGTRGEVTLVVEGVDPSRAARDVAEGSDGTDWDAEVARWLEQGATPRDAARQLAQQAGVPRRDAYRQVLQIRQRLTQDDEPPP